MFPYGDKFVEMFHNSNAKIVLGFNPEGPAREELFDEKWKNLTAKKSFQTAL